MNAAGFDDEKFGKFARKFACLEEINQQQLTYRYLRHEQTTVRKPDHCAAGAGSTGESKQRAGRRVLPETCLNVVS